jgi:hypothetical protein
MPQTFDRLGIRFQYPDNWRLDDAEAVAGEQSVTVTNPGGAAFWTVAVHPISAEPEKLVKAARRAMKEEYDSLESEWVEETIAEQSVVGYDFNFYCLDLTSTAVVRSLRGRLATYTVFYQAEDREFAEMHRVFEAITLSLMRGLGEDPVAK